MTISYSIFKSPFGRCLVASTDQGVSNILFADTNSELLLDLESRWSGAKIIKKAEAVHSQIEDYFNGSGTLPPLNFHLHGTDFQIKVWEALLSVPRGTTTTYGELAKKLGDAKGSRAVGTAIGKNPIGYLIPCHRVLTSTGAIGGFHWGIERKKAMLAHEASSR